MTLYLVLPVRGGKRDYVSVFLFTLESHMPQVNITDFAYRKAIFFYHFARLREEIIL